MIQMEGNNYPTAEEAIEAVKEGYFQSKVSLISWWHFVFV